MLTAYFRGLEPNANMKPTYAAIAFLCISTNLALASDDASGPIPYSLDLSRSFTTYTMSGSDKQWSTSLVKRLHYKGSPVHFVRTSLPLSVGKTTVQGAVYEAIEKPEYFYVVNGDAMLKLDTKWAYNPGVGGFSMHAPKSRNFIVSLNLDGGVPFLSSSPVAKTRVKWNGHDWNRFKCPC
jgi:hypothetical protein